MFPTLFRDIPFAGIHYLCYEQLNSKLENTNMSHEIQWILSASGAGIIATLGTQPQDIIKTRLQCDSRFKTSREAFFSIYRVKTLLSFLKKIDFKQ